MKAKKTTASLTAGELFLLSKIPLWVRRDRLISAVKGKQYRIAAIRLCETPFFTPTETARLTRVVSALEQVTKEIDF